MKITKIKPQYKHSAGECDRFNAECEDETVQEGFANEQEVFCPQCSAPIASWPKSLDDWTAKLVAKDKICKHVKFMLIDECDCDWSVFYFNGFDENALRALLRPIAQEDEELKNEQKQENPDRETNLRSWEPGDMTYADWDRIEPTEAVKEVLLWEPVDSPLSTAGYIIWIGLC
jgi:hypothetical protein